MSQRHKKNRRRSGGQNRLQASERQRAESQTLVIPDLDHAGLPPEEQPEPVCAVRETAEERAASRGRVRQEERQDPRRRVRQEIWDDARRDTRQAEQERNRRADGQETRRAVRRPESRTKRADPLTRFLRRLRRRERQILQTIERLHQEDRERNFPESDALFVQLLLLGWNMLPMLGSVLRERTLGRRRESFRRGSGRERRRRSPIYPILFLGTGCTLVVAVLICSTYTFGTTVTYDGEVIGNVASQSQAEDARASLEQFTTRTLGETFTIDDSLIQYKSSLLKRQELTDKDTLEADLSKEIGLVTPAYCLYVNGERIGATPYEGALEELLVKLQENATTEDTISCSFAEDVDIKPEYVPSADIMNLGHIAETLYSTKTAEVTYEVKKGDTWSQIANSHGLTSKELLALNPGYNIDRLSIGEILTLSASVPYLTMTVVQQEHYVQDLNYDIEYTDTADLYKDDYRVTSKGAFGAADVLANVTYVNGEETERTILSSVTLKEPVTEQQLRGTKARPTWHPTGSFRWPVSGRITSRFGGRRSPGGIGSTNHKGIDIAAPRGTAVCAADGGTVTYAGWMGGYGYLVRINHGNGYETYYGHNSSLTCSVGDHVYKGQQIARVGSTGNSTGNHCHFEVRLNGVARNPLNYL